MPAKLTRVRLRRHASGKDLLICRSSIAGSTHGRVASTSEAYENHCGSRETLSRAATQASAASSDLLYTDTELIVKDLTLNYRNSLCGGESYDMDGVLCY